jgi:hypothetical protein
MPSRRSCSLAGMPEDSELDRARGGDPERSNLRPNRLLPSLPHPRRQSMTICSFKPTTLPVKFKKVSSPSVNFVGIAIEGISNS